ncbi:glycosyltransferase [Bacillus sp. JZ8]
MKDINYKISIVVPIYNVEQYLHKCVSSLINQTYKNIEIILVDDGSPDQCPSICDTYAEQDDRITVIHKENGGLSDARNAGIEKAKGEYILFVDSDDYIELDTCEKLYEIITSYEVDIVVGNARRIENGVSSPMKHTYIPEREIVSGHDYLKLELKRGTMHMAAWLNLYKKSFLIDNQLNFEVGLLHEDEEFTPRAFLNASSVLGTNSIFYNYLIREGSITTSKKKLKNAEHIIKTCRKLEKIYERIEDKELKALLNDNLVDKFLNTFQTARLYSREHRKLVNKKFLENKAYTKRNRYRVMLFSLNRVIYYYVNYFFKKFKATTR